MNKILLLLFLTISNFAWGSADDSLDGTTAAHVSGETPCACDARNASNVPVGQESPEKQREHNKAQVATVEGKDVANPGESPKATN